MTYGAAVMYVVAAILGAVGVWMLLRLRRATITERQTYAYRMVGVMLTSAAIVLAFSAAAMQQWSVEA